ncbi:Complex I intermediate-associated protein 84, mitochondrial [Erysiphe necator]|uniref:Putative complex i intermediate-associated protein 84 n=1 Tax=Uncinula necator TaxID=52586 RepID=A0A0B1P314_UNCNE|nr:Complex I intermediate-associated protein 84, mitochondrial [Erysiphe necator]KHJ31715.1 putative complex i intermediate-associated protein 84 [Erysiphe necator]
MQSQLTCNVFRRILAGEGFIFYCNTRSDPLTRHCSRQSQPQIFRKCIHRTIFGFAKNVGQQPRDPSITPGLPKMIELSHMCKIGARPPLATELKKSWLVFFEYKVKNKEIVNRLQVEHALQTFEYLKNLNSAEISEKLNLPELNLASKALKRVPKDNTDHHLNLAKALYDEIRGRETDPKKKRQAFQYYIETLSLTGNTTEARELLESKCIALKKESISEQDDFTPDVIDKLWLFILKGFAREKNEAELLQTFEIARENGIVYHPAAHRVMTTFFAEKDAILQTKLWYNKPIVARGNSGSHPRPQTLATILEFCLRNNELEWCKNVFKDALSLNPSKGTWDVVLLWAAGAMGKGVEDVERMIGVMIRRNPDNEVLRPNIHTINGLVKLAMSKNDPYLAERYLTLGVKYGIRPNARTLILQLNYRCDARDLRGARAAYDALLAEEVIDDEDLPPINKYIRNICESPEPDFDLILTLINDLDERGKRLEALTVTALCNIYLDRGEIDGFVNILQTNIYHYTLTERGFIRDAFVKFCCNRYNSTLKAWDAYNILRQFFNETSVEQRTQIMNSFFERRRCDMACHTFGHMRQNTIQDRKPKLETYVSCLEGIAKLANREYLDIVHNMLKLDQDIEPNTTLYNALMLAYTSICEGGRALSFWKDITSRYEGPNYKSLEIFFWACQESNEGSIEARKIYEKMNRMGVELTAPVLAEYMGSLAKNSCWPEVKALVQSIEQEHGLKPDVRMLGTIYNCLPGDEAKAVMESWSIEHYSEIWNELRKFGRRIVKHKQYPEVRMRQFYLKRDFKAS